jgi:hypothetical protein
MPPRPSTAKKAAPAAPTSRTPAARKKQYRQVRGVRYDESALVLADDAVLQHGKITLAAAKVGHDVQVDSGGQRLRLPVMYPVPLRRYLSSSSCCCCSRLLLLHCSGKRLVSTLGPC